MKEVTNGDYKFRCETDVEVYRAETLFTKEEGTIRWLQAECRPSDVVYDIGANIGIYTVVAGKLVGRTGVVYAFEPHKPTVESLVANIQLNDLEGIVQVKPIALHAGNGMFEFNYTSKKAGTSGHQLGHRMSETGREFSPVMTETVQAMTIDSLIRSHAIAPADLVKLDVDGNELKILWGMRRYLDRTPPRSIQVEVHPGDDQAIQDFLGEYSFKLVERHYTTLGKQAIARGTDPLTVPHNAVFKV